GSWYEGLPWHERLARPRKKIAPARERCCAARKYIRSDRRREIRRGDDDVRWDGYDICTYYVCADRGVRAENIRVDNRNESARANGIRIWIAPLVNGGCRATGACSRSDTAHRARRAESRCVRRTVKCSYLPDEVWFADQGPLTAVKRRSAFEGGFVNVQEEDLQGAWNTSRLRMVPNV